MCIAFNAMAASHQEKSIEIKYALQGIEIISCNVLYPWFSTIIARKKKQLRTTTVKLTPVQPEPPNQNRTKKQNKKKRTYHFCLKIPRRAFSLFFYSVVMWNLL